jgi:phenylalanyl-tRNA synthetase beta chain
MLLLRSWLEEYIDLSAYSKEQIAEILTHKSAEVEEILSIRDYFNAKVLVGQVKNLRDHPEADRLKVFEVDLGLLGQLQIVSAATNVRDSLIVPVAIEGAKLPGLTIVSRKMRGLESFGMCCGKSELMLETAPSSGLWELNELLEAKDDPQAFLGMSICQALPEYFPEETVLDVKVLPDKISVIGSHLGLALELATCLQNQGLLTKRGQLAVNPEVFWSRAKTAWSRVTVAANPSSLSDPEAYAKAFFAFRVELDEVYHLPHEWRKRMYLTGRNQIGGVADLSNYLLADVGQPTHFFSTEKLLNLSPKTGLTGSQPRLDLRIYKLEDPQPFAGLGQLKNVMAFRGVEIMEDSAGNFLTIPGISGGDSTKVDEQETDIVVEIANFPGVRVAKSSFALNYRSDGSKIWSGEVRPALIPLTLLWLLEALPSAKTTILLNYLQDQEFGLTDWLSSMSWLLDDQPVITLDLNYLASRLDGRGMDYWRPIILEKLSHLGLVKDNLLLPNQFYSRLEQQEDVLSEIVRLVGFEALQPQFLPTSSWPRENPQIKTVQQIQDVVSAYGFHEIITRPFVAGQELVQEWLKKDDLKAFKLVNPYNSLEPYLRDSLLPSLLKSGSENILAGQKIMLYEINKIYQPGLDSKQMLGLLSEHPDPYLLTSLLHDLAHKASLSIDSFSFLPGEWDSLGKGVSYKLNNQQTGLAKAIILELKNSLKKDFNIPLNRKIWYLELDFSQFSGVLNQYPNYLDESDYPAIKRTYSYKIPANLTLAEVENIIGQSKLDGVKILITPVERIALPGGMESLNLEVEFRSYSRTLQSLEVSQWEESVLRSLLKLGQVEVR